MKRFMYIQYKEDKHICKLLELNDAYLHFAGLCYDIGPAWVTKYKQAYN